MPGYRYEATDPRGERASGTIEAATLMEAAGQLRERGLLAMTLERAEPDKPAPPLREIDAFIHFNQSLSELTRLGIPLPLAVREIAGGLRRGSFKSALEKVEAGLREGKSLEAASEAAEFPPYYRFMLRAGAASGDLPGVLSAVARNAEGILRVRKALVNALSYPAIVLAFGGAMVALFLFAILPMYEEIYRQFRIEPSLLLRGLVTFFRSPVLMVGTAAGAVVSASLLAAWMRRTESGERVLYAIPLVGPVLRQLALARFFGTLSILLKAKARLPDAVPVALGASGSVALRAATEAVRRAVSEGGRLSAALEGRVPAAACAYVALAEKVGRVADATAELADLMGDQAADASESIFLVLFPAAILVIGALLGTVCVTIILPYFTFLEQVGR